MQFHFRVLSYTEVFHSSCLPHMKPIMILCLNGDPLSACPSRWPGLKLLVRNIAHAPKYYANTMWDPSSTTPRLRQCLYHPGRKNNITVAGPVLGTSLPDSEHSTPSDCNYKYSEYLTAFGTYLLSFNMSVGAI